MQGNAEWEGAPVQPRDLGLQPAELIALRRLRSVNVCFPHFKTTPLLSRTDKLLLQGD